jgi:hypothetical protein
MAQWKVGTVWHEQWNAEGGQGYDLNDGGNSIAEKSCWDKFVGWICCKKIKKVIFDENDVAMANIFDRFNTD